jgi:pimeloyl-ACP methyl ester carboxylesterase
MSHDHRTVPLQAIIDGPKAARPVMLLTGLGQQAIDWPGNLIDLLLTQGYRVIRPDHRDAGLSPLCGAAVVDYLVATDFPGANGVSQPGPYRLFDMAGDVLALMDRLDIAAAHLIGYSMGGMIAQIVAATAPQRTLSLTSLMSSGGQPWIACSAAAQAAMADSICAVVDERERIRRYVENALVFAGPGFPIDIKALTSHAGTVLARGYRPAGIWRQALAIRHSGDRRALLRTITTPTLLVHGDADTCIQPSQTLEGHALVRDSKLMMIAGAGHDLHPDIIPLLSGLLSRHLSDADGVHEAPISARTH